MGCSCLINNNENEIIYTNKIENIPNDFQSEKYNSSLIKFNQLYNDNLSNLSSTNKTFSFNYPISRIKPQEIIFLLNTLPPLKLKIKIELHLPIKYDNQGEYWGETKKNTKIRHGRGIQIWIDGTKYEGYWLDDKANIKGKLIHSDGDIYEGEWKDDKVEGFGKYIHVDGSKYEGQWKDDKQHGKGIETWADGTSYEGDYIAGKKHGYGIFKWNEKEFLLGLMEENMKGNIKMIKKKAMANLNGTEEKNIKDIGKMENNMEKVCYIILKIKVGEKEFGIMEKESNGLKNDK